MGDKIGPHNTEIPKCKKCRVKMKKGISIRNTLSGVDDFVGVEIMTIHYGGSGKLLNVWKCPQCGFSLSIGTII